jgi:hypothetical protein
VEGLEPPNGGTKNRCLTTWRHPKRLQLFSLLTSAEKTYKISAFFAKSFSHFFSAPHSFRENSKKAFIFKKKKFMSYTINLWRHGGEVCQHQQE